MHTNFTLSQTDSRPMYRQIMERIKQRVAVGDWQPGAKIPSIRELAVALRVSVITIKRAYLELERENVIVTRHGKGSFVATDPTLGSKLHEQELTHHLTEAVRLASLLGWDREELLEQLDDLDAAREQDTADRPDPSGSVADKEKR